MQKELRVESVECVWLEKFMFQMPNSQLLKKVTLFQIFFAFKYSSICHFNSYTTLSCLENFYLIQFQIQFEFLFPLCHNYKGGHIINTLLHKYLTTSLFIFSGWVSTNRINKSILKFDLTFYLLLREQHPRFTFPRV